MPAAIPESLQEKIEERLRYYEDLGIRFFYRDRAPAPEALSARSASASPGGHSRAQESSLAKGKSKVERPVTGTPPVIPEVKPSGASLFEEVDKIHDDTLLKIREDIGDCTRCKLHKGRNKLVFGDGSPTAELVFVGEGPGADEDRQGLPFVGRAGKLLTQMIEAMGLQRKDVYICNVVKCRPPENRVPEPDEVHTCSPYLLRQIDVINPKVIVCLGAVAAKALLQTTKGITQFRGQWLEWRGRKLMATYHPAYLLRNPPAKADVWKDLQKVMAELGLSLPKKKSS
ncbi:MAG TPA: uracil-DNA glycosylase [Verrucomicrobiae bacterium]|jgi:uracil-DNA glycosylase|nr:uracil-DNA glycosylase [Verrucomicrobiae bacterium]